MAADEIDKSWGMPFQFHQLVFLFVYKRAQIELSSKSTNMLIIVHVVIF